MYNNYLILYRHIFELIPLLINSVVEEVYTQEKDTLFFLIKDYNNFNKHFIISTKANSPTFYLKNDHKKSKKNTILFFKDILPDKIVDIAISKQDRIIKVGFTNAELYFFYWGPKSNVIVVKDNNIHSFKKTEENLLNNKYLEIQKQSFTNIKENILEFVNGYDLSNKNFFENKSFINEVKNNLKNEEILSTKEIKENIIKNIFTSSILVGWDKLVNNVILTPQSFYNSKDLEFSKSFTNVNDAIQYYIGLQSRLTDRNNKKAILEKYIEKELSKLGDKLNNLKNRINSGSKEDLYYHYGNLLLTNLNNYVIINDDTIRVFDYTTEKDIEIKVSNVKNIKSSLDNYFDKARNEKINYNKSIELFEKTEKKYFKFIEYQKKMSNIQNYDNLMELINELKLGSTKMNEKENNKEFNFKEYIAFGKYKVYVGRDSTNNDLLTTRFAKQNDFWFHVRGSSGSHVVLRVENTKEVIPKNVLKAVASLAAYHSKAKNAGVVPVVYTLKKYVIKKKGMNVGQVALLKEDVLLVKPEITKEIEFVDDED